ncbi:MAG: DUF4328 domain-containing protein [Actinomycetota bacterium]
MSEPELPSSYPPPPPPPPTITPPPGYISYGGPGAAMPHQFQPVKRFTVALVVILAASMVVSLVAALWQAMFANDAQRFLDGLITQREFDSAYESFSQFSFIAFPLGIAGIVLSSIWSYRIANNLTNAGRAPITWKSGLTILVWILSCLLGVLPFLLLREHWRASDPELGFGDPTWKQRPVSPLVTAWFVANLVGQLASIVAVGSVMSNFDPNAADDATTLAKQFTDQADFIIPGAILSLVASVLLIMVIRALGARHMRLTREA